MLQDFYKWLNEEIAWRGWTQAEFARRARLSTAHLSRVLMGNTPGPDFCNAVASVLGLPPSKVFRMAGLLSSYSVGDDERAEMMEYWDALKPEQRAQLKESARSMAYFNAMEAVGGQRPSDKQEP